MRVARVAVLSIAFIASVPVQAVKRGSFASGYMYSYYIPPAAGSPWRPCWSPDGNEIAFSMSGSIWKMNAGFSRARAHSQSYLRFRAGMVARRTLDRLHSGRLARREPDADEHGNGRKYTPGRRRLQSQS